MQPLIEFFGRLHPMILHAPIGLLIGLVAVEAIALARRVPPAPGVRATLAWLAAASAAVSAGTGWVLHLEGGFDPETVDLHEWLGIGVAAACVIAAVAQQIRWGRVYLTLLGLSAVAIIPAGHLGASMTHGAGFLTEPFRGAGGGGEQGARQPRTSEPVGTRGGEAPSLFATAVSPVLTRNCVSCHGGDRRKAGLDLHTFEAMMEGSNYGSVVEPGDAAASLLIRRMRLPLDDEDHMPPKGRRQPTEAQISAIEAWVQAGASPSDGPAADGAAVPPVPADAAPDPAPPPPAGPPPIPAADPGAIKALQDRLVHVAPMAQGSPLLAVDFAALGPGSGVTEPEMRSLLAPLRVQVADLSIARTPAGDSLMELVSLMPNLRRLNAGNTAVTDAGLALLATQAGLEELVLARTRLTESAGAVLAAMPSLKRLYLWDSGLSADSLKLLRDKGILVDAGDAPAAEALEAETEVKLTNEAPVPGQTPQDAAAALKPVNTICPVSGKPVDPNYVIVFKGKAVGFCCQHCPVEFWADPAKFEDKIKP